MNKELTIEETFNLTVKDYQENKTLYLLLLEVEKSKGYPVLLNNSFNLPGEPMVELPHDVLSSFSRGTLDYLFIENILISR